MIFFTSCQGVKEKNIALSKEEKEVKIELKEKPLKLEKVEIKKEVLGFDTLNIFPIDTLVGKLQLKFRQINLDEFKSKKHTQIRTTFEQDNASEYLQRKDSCYYLTLGSNQIDTLCSFDDGEYHESYKFSGYSKRMNTIMFDWENWEEAHSFLINLNQKKYWLLNPKVELSPDRNRIVTFSNFIDDPLYEGNNFYIFELTKDSIITNYSFSNVDYGIFYSKWIGKNEIILHFKRIDNEKFEPKESYYFEIEIKNDL
ncbi:hypothetical protein D1614_11895 [Maribellus luteus]|uniref:Uncharacterized protein n=2 Tax=Maribellus luteus TaxID=2305463 RepID=A0A399T134_9BACT|nr:hypothetical protein D1614_11895 [Maribellus luteus]